MNKFGLLFVIAGLFLAIFYPWGQIKFTGEDIGKATIYQRSGGGKWLQHVVELDPLHNPVRIRLHGYFLPGGAFIDNAIPLTIRVSGADGTVLEGVIKLSTSSANQHAPEKDRIVHTRDDGTVLLSNSAPLFDIVSAGKYTIEIGSEEKVDFSLSSVDVVVLAKVTAPNTSYRWPGIALIVFGLIMLFAGRKRRKKGRKKQRKRESKRAGASTGNVGNDESIPDKKQKITRDKPPALPDPPKRKIRWGRRASDK